MARPRDRQWFNSVSASSHAEMGSSSTKGLLPLPYSPIRHNSRLHLRVLRTLTSRRFLQFSACILLLLALKVLSAGIPSTYGDIREFERGLPQHNLTEALEKGTRYLRIPKPVSGRGLNNVLQESLLLSYLALLTNRAFVFEDYVWSHSPLPYTLDGLALRPSRMPLNAFISGPTAGGPMPMPIPISPPTSTSTSISKTYPRAVSAEFWEQVCPRSRRKVISSIDQPDDLDGKALMDWWVARLEVLDDYPCVEIDSGRKTIFDFILFGDTRILTLWPGLSKSPILTAFKWSALVQSTVDQNLGIIHPGHAKASSLANPDTNADAILPGLIAVHLRRGDFKGHCKYLARWHAQYMGFNRFPGMLDELSPSSPSSVEMKDWPPEVLKQHYMQHCIPDIPQVVARLRAVRMANPGLNRVYALTNGGKGWVGGLKRALRRDGWVDVRSSLDLELGSAQQHVSMAVDMAVAERAEVFLGNGFSSLTSNVVTLRMAKGLPTSSNRFL